MVTASAAISPGGGATSGSLLRFFCSFLINAFTLIRKLLIGVQSSADTGEWLQIGHVSGRASEPALVSMRAFGRPQAKNTHSVHR